MNLHIKPISAENKKEALQLNVKTEQSSFIEPVSQCIQEAEQLDLWNPVAIYHGTDMIGFAMYGFFGRGFYFPCVFRSEGARGAFCKPQFYLPGTGIYS